MLPGHQNATWDVCWDFARPVQAATGTWNSWESIAYASQMMPLWPASNSAEWFPPWGTPGRDALGAASQSAPGQAGDMVLPKSVQKRLAEKAKQQGKSKRGPPEGTLPPPPPSEKEYKGILKSLSSRNGYGFVACDEIHRVYGRDVHLPEEIVPGGVKVGDKLTFTVVLSSKGHPQVQSVIATQAAESSS
mmetsp:Transcript_13077/g.24059  ORF Transcript_13077/g.24059 Transcript_13077/m.24059 type:complete len:190 (+) Transcript_13077:60-629(+)